MVCFNIFQGISENLKNKGSGMLNIFRVQMQNDSANNPCPQKYPKSNKKIVFDGF